MRVLIILDPYKLDAPLSANGSVQDAVNWVENWIEFDDNIHVYYLTPYRDTVYFDDEYLHAESDQVTVLQGQRMEYVDGFRWLNGYTTDEWETLQEPIQEDHAYYDVVVDQRHFGQHTLWGNMHSMLGLQSNAKPCHIVYNTTDMCLPYKNHGQLYPNQSMVKNEFSVMHVVDRVWLKCRTDEDDIQEYASEWYDHSTVRELLDKSLQIHGTIKLDGLDETYNDEPTHIHIAGDMYPKKQGDILHDFCKFMYERYGVETIRTSMHSLKDKWKDPAFVTEAHGECPYDTFRRMLDKGDICPVASKYEAGVHTYFEQAAAGQVFMAMDYQWVYDQVPRDYKMIAGDRKSFKKVGAWMIANWEQAVEENKRMVEYMAELRAPENVARRSYNDLLDLVEQRVEEHNRPGWGEKEILPKAIEYVGEEPFSIAEINRASRHFTDSGDKMLGMQYYTLPDLVCSLRCEGYRDIGNPGVPKFESGDYNKDRVTKDD